DMALARVEAELLVTRHQLRDARAAIGALAAEQARAAATPVTSRLARELVATAAAAFRLARRAAVGFLVVALTLVAVPLVACLAVALAATDVAAAARRRRQPARAAEPPRHAGPRVAQPVSIVIPTWNG